MTRIDISALTPAERAAFREGVAELGDRPPSTAAAARRSADLTALYELERGHPPTFHTPFAGMTDDWSKWLEERAERAELDADEQDRIEAEGRRAQVERENAEAREFRPWRGPLPTPLRGKPQAGSRSGDPPSEAFLRATRI